jgi:hypothetical protein
MRTALYVQQPSTVTITVRVADAKAAAIKLYRYNHPGCRPAVGTHQLERGIYMVVSDGEIMVDTGDVVIEAASGDKDPLPGPRAQVVGLEPGATIESLQEFFAIAKDV